MNVSPLDSPAPPAETNAGSQAGATRWVPTPRTLRFVAKRPPALPWLFWATAALGLLAMIASPALLIPAGLVLLLTVLTGVRWRAAKSLAEQKNAEVSSAPGRHARADDADAVSALVPAQRSAPPTDTDLQPAGRHRLVDSGH
ncbi:hypothetical protein ACTXG6_44110 [Pseudonocardia sp. Cha107L01]|uniref:hypothetical protein n=1 Tax=Pseudonocardia sp. Cha107L01 TaxID=3457576 RepID=UPI00403EB47F